MRKDFLNELRLWGKSLSDFLFPRYCTCCGKRLALGEACICSGCLMRLPLSDLPSYEDNELTRIFLGLIPIRKAASYFLYSKSSPYTRILFDLKYYGHPEVGRTMGRLMSQDLSKKGFFNDIDLIVPIPLFIRKERARGYNQSLWIAYGIAETTGLAIEAGSVARVVHTPSQTTLSHAERRTNVKGIFKVIHPERIDGRHILLVDDVITTGSTLLSCAEAIAGQCDVSVSILTMAQSVHS